MKKHPKNLIVYDVRHLSQGFDLNRAITDIENVIAYESNETKRCFAILLLKDVISSKKIKKVPFEDGGLPVKLKFLRDIAQFDAKGFWIGGEPTAEMIKLADSVLNYLYKKIPLLLECEK